ncbi:hypothetical protein RDWZM_006278 [Blomia tropicalis]|uniref:Septin-type G domain-containing protein n=1 Tax=Blomia tropicalis TaxID=40697 RepID=A0A9Q0RP67_BLOTA|nr:hypothetical protein RDWZM_006278 [Blomia tropicalis]
MNGNNTSQQRSMSAVRPKEIGGNFQSLVAGWEYNTAIGKGVTASTLVSFPSRSNLVSSHGILPKPCQPTTITINNVPVVANSIDLSAKCPQTVCIDENGDIEPTRPNTIFNSPIFSSQSNINSLTPLTPTSTINRNAALREQFMLGCNGSTHSLANTPSSTPMNSSSRQLTQSNQMSTSTSFNEQPLSVAYAVSPSSLAPNYRFAGVERLSQRGNIYDSPPTFRQKETEREEVKPNSTKQSLNSKREYYFRDSASPTSGLTNGSSKDYSSSRDRVESSLMGFNTRNGEDSTKPSSLSGKDGEPGFVGFSYLPNQIHRKTVKKGFEFTLMVVGESGLGKSTLVNSMFLTDIYSNEYPGPSKRASKTVEVETTRVLLKEKSVNLHLTVVDTPGYGTAVDNTNCWQPIVNFIESRYEEHLNAETRVHRTHIQDNRVHCCLYFISPSGHSLKPIDVDFMLHLHDKVNIIPVIAKADTLTPEEITIFKKNIMNEINQHKIKVYDFPESDEEEDGKLLKSMKGRIPFAVVGSNYVFEVNNERKRGRKYPWGLVEIENLEHCDFQALRNLLIRHYMLDLLETTNNVHYENYRCRKLTGISPDMAKKGKDNNNHCNHGNSNRIMNTSMVFWNPLAQMEEEKKEHDYKMKKMEIEMEQVFEQKVKEKLNKLKESEEEYMRRHEEMTKKLEQQQAELNEKRAAFDKEKAAFELISKDMEEIRRVSTLDVNMRELNLDGKGKEKKKKGLF